MPMLADTVTVASPTTIGAHSSRTRRSAIVRDRRRSGRSSVRIANSSPPTRASTSPSRIRDWIRRATASSTASPTAVPWASLTAPKSSRSRYSTADVRVPRRPLVHSARCRLAWKVRRLAVPVRASRSWGSSLRRRRSALLRLSAVIAATRSTTASRRRSAPRWRAKCRSSTIAPIGRLPTSIGATITRRAPGRSATSAGALARSNRGIASGTPVDQARLTSASTPSDWPIFDETPWRPSTTRPSSPIPSTRPREKP